MTGDKCHNASRLYTLATLIDQLSKPDDFAASAATGRNGLDLRYRMDGIAHVNGTLKLPIINAD